MLNSTELYAVDRKKRQLLAFYIDACFHKCLHTYTKCECRYPDFRSLFFL